MGIGRARAKLLLLGEHAAVYGHPAVGCSLPWHLRAELEAGPDWQLLGLEPHHAQVSELLSRLTEQGLRDGFEVRPGRLTVTTNIPLGAGFGSSAALCAALVNLYAPSLSDDQKERAAWKAETLFHGTPSGIDTALALRQGWSTLDTAVKPARATALDNPGLALVVGAVEREADTRTLVAGLARKRDSDPQVRQTIDHLGFLSSRAVTALQGGKTHELPLLVRDARRTLASLGLETAALTAAIEAGLKAPGALAGKLSGAGGGGAFFVLFEDERSAQKALASIRAAVAPALWKSLPQALIP